MLWCCFNLTKLEDGDRKGLVADASRAFLESACIMTSFRPLGDAPCDEDDDGGTWPPFGVFGLWLACVALKLSSSIPCGDGFGKLGLSYSALLCESMTIDSGFSVSQLISHHTLPQNRF